MVTLQFIPYNEIEALSSAKRIQKLLGVVKGDKIVLLQGRLRKEEEKDLIEITMEEIDDKFKGIELSVVYPNKNYKTFLERFRKGVYNYLLGDRAGMTIIGPATVVKEIKKDPNKIELFTKDEKSSVKKGRKK
mgnify:CR=1 FL=1